MIEVNGCPCECIWDRLAATDRPIVIYGMGDGADKMLRALEDYGIKCDGIFASDGFVRGQSFHDMPVLSLDGALERFGSSMLALLAFGSRRGEVIEYIKGVAQRCELYAPMLPVVGETRFDRRWYLEHRAEHEAARALLCDDESRRVFDDILRYRLSGDISILLEPHMCSPEADALRLIGVDDCRSCLDLGAYTGDTLAQLAELNNGALEWATALEPERHSFKKLKATAAELEAAGRIRHVRALNMCVGDACGSVEFSAGRGRGSRSNTSNAAVTANSRTVSVECVTPDSLYRDTLERQSAAPLPPLPDYIKLDVEGAEHAALVGAARILNAARSALNVALYHRPEDIFDIPLLLNSLRPNSTLYLRRHGGLPDWDLNLYVV